MAFGNEREVMAKMCCATKEFGPLHFDTVELEVYFAKDDLLASLVESEDPAFYEFEHPLRGCRFRVSKGMTYVQIKRWCHVDTDGKMFTVDEGGKAS